MKISDIKWTYEVPKKPGFYLFYGEDLAGDMGEDYKKPLKDFKKDFELRFVEIWDNGIIVTNGYFMNARKFNQTLQISGYLGMFSTEPIEIGSLPEVDVNLFK
jgi:hypothetical protein